MMHYSAPRPRSRLLVALGAARDLDDRSHRAGTYRFDRARRNVLHPALAQRPPAACKSSCSIASGKGGGRSRLSRAAFASNSAA
jgi:hypothetical protein